MSASERFQSTETRRGGCLDAAVKVVSFGMFGLETTIQTPKPITPTEFLTNDAGDTIVDYIATSATRRAIETGEPVIINDFFEANAQKVSRRIVRNRPTQ